MNQKPYIGRYVCTCMKVTLKDIEDAISAGASDFRAVHIATRCGGKCGACIDTIKLVVEELLNERNRRISSDY